MNFFRLSWYKGVKKMSWIVVTEDLRSLASFPSVVAAETTLHVICTSLIQAIQHYKKELANKLL
jgi:hypothetical protein